MSLQRQVAAKVRNKDGERVWKKTKLKEKENEKNWKCIRNVFYLIKESETVNRWKKNDDEHKNQMKIYLKWK